MKSLYLLWIGSIALGFFWSLMVPLFEFPDEQAHFAMVQFISEEGRRPDLKENDLSNEMIRTEEIMGTFRDDRGINKFTYHPEYRHAYSEGLWGPRESTVRGLNTNDLRSTYEGKEAAPYPILYYAYSALAYLFVYDMDVIERVFAVRLWGGLFMVMIVYLSYRLGKVVFRDEWLAVALTILVSLHPSLRFVSAGVNSDVLHFLLVTWGLYLGAVIIRDGWSVQLGSWSGLCLGLDLLCKPQGYILGVTMVMGWMIAYLVHRDWRGLIRMVGVFGIVVMVVAGWHEWPKLMSLLQGNDPLIRENKVNTSGEFLPFLQYSVHMLYSQNIIWYWGVFKWLGVVLPRPIWWTVNRLVLLSGLGILLGIINYWRQIRMPMALAHLGFLVCASILYVVAIFWFDWRHFLTFGYSLGIQGRYYLPLVSAHMTLMIVGFWVLGVRERIARVLVGSLGLWFIIMHLTAVYTVLNSYYEVSSWPRLIMQIGQYKPLYAKGDIWIVIFGLLVVSMAIYLLVLWKECLSPLFSRKKN